MESDIMDLMDKNWVRIEALCDVYTRSCYANWRMKHSLFNGEFTSGLTVLDCEILRNPSLFVLTELMLKCGL